VVGVFYFQTLEASKMKCSKCQFENPDDAKFCVECANPMELHCPNCGAITPATWKFCKECAYDLRKPKEAPPEDLSFDEKLTKIQRYLPKGLTEKILSQRDRIEGERKQVTVMFADMEGFTQLSEKLGPEEAYTIMDQVYEILIHKVHDYEGTVNEMTGDGIMALFGAPIALEDAPQRAIRSAYAIHREMTKFSDKIKQEKQNIPSLKMRIGINAGPVVVGTLGNDLRLEFKAVGDTVNLASRMEGLAEPGSTYVTDEMYKLTEGLFRCEALGEHAIKGKEGAVKAYRVIAPSTRKTRFDVSAERGLTPFVGRERELELLLDGFERSKAGRGQAFSIVSEAGVGKSRLLYEFRKAVANEDVTFLEGKCLSYSRGVAYHPVIDILKSNFDIKEGDGDYEIREKLKRVLKILGADEVSILPYLLEFLSVKDSGIDTISLSPEARKDRFVEALIRIALKASEIRPLIWAIEDLHWIDKSSEHVSKSLLDSITGARVFMIFTYRPEFVHTWGGKSYLNQITLNRLSNRESLAMVTHLLGTKNIDRDLENSILEKTEGVPFFIEEFIKSLKDLKIIEKKDNTYQLAKDVKGLTIPSTIQDVIMARVDSLPEGAKEVLQTGSIIEREFSYELIKHLSGLPEQELLSRLSVLKDSELLFERGIYPESTYIFKHALTREVVYNNLLLKRRKEFHRRIGEAIEKIYADTLKEHHGALAFHFYQAEAWEKAFKYLTTAGERARFAYATHEAIDFFNKAVEASRNIPDAVSKEQLMRLYESRGRTWLAMMEFEKAADDFQNEIEILRKLGNKKKEAQALLSLVRCYGHYAGLAEIDKTQEYLDKALKLIRETGDVDGEMRYYIFAGMVIGGDVGQLEKAQAHLQKAIDICRKFRNKRGLGLALGSSGLRHSWMGEFETSIKKVQESADIAREIGNQFLLVSTFHWASFGHVGRGEYDEALKALELLDNGAKEIGSKHFIAMVPNCFGWIYNEMCNFEKAVVHDKNGVDLSQRLEEPECEIFSLLNLVDDHIGLGDYDKAQHYLEEVQEKRELKWYRVREWRYAMHFSRYVSELSLLKGEYLKAMEFAEDTLTRGQKTAAKKYIAIGWKLKGEVLLISGRIVEAAECFQKALDLADQMGYPPLMWKTRYLLSRVYEKQRKPEAVRDASKQAVGIIKMMASKVSDTEVKQTFLNSEPIQAVYKQLNAF
jgi:predicted ATPase/class 3 adenylate cyclase